MKLIKMSKYIAILFLMTSCSYQAAVAWDWGRSKTVDEKLREHDEKMRKLSQELEHGAWGR